MKKIIFIFLVIFEFNELKSQSIQHDILLLKNHSEKVQPKKFRKYTPLNKNNIGLIKINPVNLFFSGLMFFYQNVLSSQINANCIYTPSCSEFGKCSIKQHGLLMGVFLTADRLNRCNRVTALEQIKGDPKHKGKIADDCSEYKFKE